MKPPSPPRMPARAKALPPNVVAPSDQAMILPPSPSVTALALTVAPPAT
jgi:hypothetical protein